jgi:TPP-dependent pyruvate/acetoin dehydrogenase alpha subunit
MIWTVEALKAFEKDIAECFNRGEIRAPIHLDGGNEEQLIEIFKDIKSEDWVCGSWRMHYKCLLKSVPSAQLKRDILAGRSITLCYQEFRIISSAIVGGILPIALGLALSIKRTGGKERVWAFLGDMTAKTGMYHECVVYAQGFDLPIKFVIENNNLSVCTPTQEVWGSQEGWRTDRVIGFNYTLPFPHSGAGKRINF